MSNSSIRLCTCLAALKNGHREGRRLAAIALGLLGDEEAMPAVRDALASETDDAVREVLRWASRSIGVRAGVPADRSE